MARYEKILISAAESINFADTVAPQQIVHPPSSMDFRADNALRKAVEMCRLCVIDEESIPVLRRRHSLTLQHKSPDLSSSTESH
jgi:hypothetical protein